jgi:hypothetical protein
VVEVLKLLPALLLVCGPPFVAAAAGVRVVGWVWVLGLAAMAFITTVNEPDNYDMPGLGLRLFGSAALLALVALGLGSALRRLRRGR